MYKKIINLIFIIILLVFITFIFNKTSDLYMITNNTIEMFLKNVFPYLFIMIIINNLLIKINFPYFINKIFKNNYIYPFIMSMLSGSPLNAIIIRDYLDNNLINKEDASKMLSFTCFNNPLFLYHYFHLLFNNKTVIIKLFFIIYITNLVFFIIFLINNKKSSNKVIYKNINVYESIFMSIKKSIYSIINIFAIILFFKIISDLLMPNNNTLSSFLKGLIEITSGLNIFTKLNISLLVKQLLVITLIQFNGLSIHMQIESILNNYNINYKYFYKTKIILIIISIIMVYMHM